MHNVIIGVIAPKGSGKTHAVTQAIPGMERVAIFDMLREFSYIQCSQELIVGEPRKFGNALMAEQFKITYRPTVFLAKGDDYECPEFHWFAKACYMRGDMWMIVDEAHYLCTAHTCPAVLYDAAVIGRHRRLNVIYITQSFSAVSRMLTRNTDEFWFFRISEPIDLQGIRDRCGDEIRDRVRSLRGLQKPEPENNKPLVPGEMLRWTRWGETEIR